MTVTTTTRPMIWVGCLACYNDGRLVGEWLEPDDVDGLSTDEVRNLIHKEVPAPNAQGFCEEVWVFDHEGFGGLLKGECSPWEAAEVAKFIDTRLDGSENLPAFVAWRSMSYADAELDDDLVEVFRNEYNGRWESAEAWAHEYLTEVGLLGTLPAWVDGYQGAIVRAWLHDQTEGGSVWSQDAPEGGVFVFGG